MPECDLRRGLWHSLEKWDGAGKGVTEKKPVLLSPSMSQSGKIKPSLDMPVRVGFQATRGL